MTTNLKRTLLLLVLIGSFAVYLVVRADPDIIHFPAILRGASPGSAALAITGITDNRQEYPNGQVPAYEKFEITFQVSGSTAKNPYFPYDSNPPAGVDRSSPSYQGISVNAVFTPDNWQTTYTQPAFYFQEFLDEVRVGREWFYPTGQYSWKVRFAPHQPGAWQYRLSVQEASGSLQSSPVSFNVGARLGPGFVRVSQADRRYFEFDDGSYFNGLGYNKSFDAIQWVNPVLDNQDAFEVMQQNGIQLARMWLSQWSIYTSAWNPWNSIVPDQSGQYIPFSGLTSAEAYTPGGSETSMIVNSAYNPCMFIGWLKAPPAVKPQTNYRIRIRYMTQNIAGPRQPGSYGLVAKIGGWLYDDVNGPTCDDPGNGTVVTAYQNQNTFSTAERWRVLEGAWNSGSANFLPNFYLTTENVTAGRAFIDYIWIEEDLGSGQVGPNIVSKPWMSHHLYFEQRNSYAFDKVVDLAHQHDIYLRPVLLEKNEWILNRILPDGSFDDANPSNNNFYGEHRSMTRTRWLEQAWWRYVQARWGYSSNIQSWELLNEGDPASTRHFALADELGKFMNCKVFDLPVGAGSGEECVSNHPNRHLVSTSNWHSFPVEAFWANASYPNLDFADVHAYNSTGWLDDPLHEDDAASYHIDYSAEVRRMLQAAAGDAGMPIIRGEAGLDTLAGGQVEQADLALDLKGVWLHNYLWSSLHPGGMIDHYWWTTNLEQRPGPDGSPGLHEVFGYFSSFLAGIPLNNGHYQDAAATLSSAGLRVVGQKDTSANRAHLWVQNKNHIWRNVVDNLPNLGGLSGTVSLGGFTPNTTLAVTWHEFTTAGVPSLHPASVTTNAAGVLTLALPANPQITDVGIKIGTYP